MEDPLKKVIGDALEKAGPTDTYVGIAKQLKLRPSRIYQVAKELNIVLNGGRRSRQSVREGVEKLR